MATEPVVAESGVREAMRPVAPVWHTVVMLLLLGVWALLGYRSAGMMRAESAPPRMALYATTLVAEWILFGFVVFGIRRKGVSLRELTGPKWKGAEAMAIGIGIAAGFWFAALLILSVVARLLGIHAAPTQATQFMIPHTGAEMAVWVLLAITAGICEETIFRGYLQQQFIAWTRNVPAGVILSAIFFGAGHVYQGVRQAALIGVYGALFGILAAWRRDVKPGMIAHGWQDTFAGAASFVIYKMHIKLPGM
jgi:uncharacterized protein